MDFPALVNYWRIEIMGGVDKPLRLRRLRRRLARNPDHHYLFWFRLAQYLYRKPEGWINFKKWALRIHLRLQRLHNIDIMLGAEIGTNLKFAHRVGIVITDKARIGNNFYVRQNTTIGVRDQEQEGCIYIGHNVQVGANSCIIGDNLRIGDNVVIGAMSFVNRDIPSGSVYYSTHLPNIRPAHSACSSEEKQLVA